MSLVATWTRLDKPSSVNWSAWTVLSVSMKLLIWFLLLDRPRQLGADHQPLGVVPADAVEHAGAGDQGQGRAGRIAQDERQGRRGVWPGLGPEDVEVELLAVFDDRHGVALLEVLETGE